MRVFRRSLVAATLMSALVVSGADAETNVSQYQAEETARLIAMLLSAGRTVIDRNQSLLDDANKADKGFTPERKRETWPARSACRCPLSTLIPSGTARGSESVSNQVKRPGRSITAVLALALWLGTGLAAQAADKYAIKDIGAIPNGSTVESLNNEGQIAGTTPVSPTRNNAWWYDGKKVVELGTCGGVGCRAMDINTKGMIVGNIGRDAFIHVDGKFLDISLFVRPPGIALGVNDFAEVVGWYTLIPVFSGEHHVSERHAFLYGLIH